MRVFLIDQATSKTLKLVYSSDSITLSGIVEAPGSSVAHLSDEHTPPKVTGDSVVPPHSFDTVVPEAAISTEPAPENKSFSITITFEDLKAMPGFACHSQALVAVNMLTGETELYEGFSRSYRTKRTDTAMKANWFTVMHIGIPSSAVESFDDCGVFAHSAADAFTFDGEYRTVSSAEARALYAQLAITGPDNVVSAGSQFVVTYAWPDGTPIAGAEVWSETTAGYVNRRRAITDEHGQAKFSVLPLALDKGESVRLKFGFKHYSGKVQKILIVS